MSEPERTDANGTCAVCHGTGEEVHWDRYGDRTWTPCPCRARSTAKPQPVAVEPGDRFTIQWDASMGCYRVSVPELSMNGELVEVVRATAHDEVEADRDRLAEDLLRIRTAALVNTPESLRDFVLRITDA